MRVERKLPAFEGVGANQTATLKVPIGVRYHRISLLYGGTFTLANMTEIRVIVNGKVVQRFSGTDRDAMNQFDGLEAAAGILVLPFDRIGLKLYERETETAINTGSRNDQTGAEITNFTVEVDISGATAPTLEGYATVSDALPGGPGSMLFIKKFTYAPAGAGDYEIADLPKGTSETLSYNRIWFKPDANNITYLKVERNGYISFERTSALNIRLQTDGVRVPQTGYYAIDTTEAGYGGQLVPLVGLDDFRLRLTVDGAMSLPTTVEYFGTLIG